MDKFTFESGEVAIINDISPSACIGGAGQLMQTALIVFNDSSTITVQRNGIIEQTLTGSTTSGDWSGDIISATGRFEGIIGTITARAEFALVEQGEVHRIGNGQGTMAYTVPVDQYRSAK